MQDNRLDEQFTDHAWNEMRKLLDEEMPVRGGLWFTRRRQWMAAAAVLLLLVAATAVWRWTMTTGPVEGLRDVAFVPPVEAQEQEAAEKARLQQGYGGQADLDQGYDGGSEVIAEATVSLQPENGQNSREESAKAGGTTIRKGATRVSGGQKSGTAPSVRSTSRHRAAGGVVINRSNIADRSAEDAIKKSTPEATVPVFEPVSSAALPAVVPSGVDALAQLEPGTRTGLEISIPVPDINARIDLSGREEDKEDKKAFALIPDRWGVQGSTVAGSRAALDGAAFGLTGEFRFGNSPFSLQSGVRYLYQNRNFSFQDPGPATRKESDPSTLGNGGVSTSVSTFDPKVFPLAARTHSLNVPVMVDYRIGGGKLGIQAGVQMNYAVLAQRSDNLQDVSGSFKAMNVSVDDDQTLSLLTTQPEAVYQNSLLERWDVGLAGGLHYQATRQIGLNLRYNFGLVDLVRSDYYSAYNRFFGMGVTFYIR